MQIEKINKIIKLLKVTVGSIHFQEADNIVESVIEELEKYTTENGETAFEMYCNNFNIK